MMQYTCGFLFSEDGSRVLLIRKLKPAWQAGKLNGIGGKVEAGETALCAMVREAREEAALTDAVAWQHFASIDGTDFHVSFYRAFGDPDWGSAQTAEPLEVHPSHDLPADVLPNLRWLIPLALDRFVKAPVLIKNVP